MSTKIKEASFQHGNLGQNQLNTATPASSIINIADLVGIVNPTEGDFLKYFPDSMLDSEQIKGKQDALKKDAEKYEKLVEKTAKQNVASGDGVAEDSVRMRSRNLQDEKGGIGIEEDIAEIEAAIEETLKNGAENAIFRAMESEGEKGDLTSLRKGLKKNTQKQTL